MDLTNYTTNERQMIGKIESSLGMKLVYFCDHADGFSIGLGSELEAYKAAYSYRYTKKTKLHYSNSGKLWLLQIYT